MTYPWTEALLSALSDRAVSERLHHALLLSGGEGIGLDETSADLAKMLLCQTPVGHKPCGKCQSCQLYQAGNHPDDHHLRGETSIGVDDVRVSIGELQKHAHIAPRKVLTIHAAETMTAASANALLKTLEEPLADTYVILLSHRPQGLLATIRSRCEQHRVTGPTAQQLTQWLDSQGVGQVRTELVSLYANAPLVLLEQLKGSDEFDRLHRDFEHCLQGRLSAQSFAKHWHGSLDVVQRLLYQQAQGIATSVDRATGIQQCLTQLAAKGHQPGLNKELLLAQTMATIRDL